MKPDKREEIVRSALELIAEHGFHGAPMAMIADRAGVGAGTIYRYFENKDVLIREIYADLEVEAWSVIMDGYPADGPIHERFLHICRKLVCYLLSSPQKHRFIEQFYNSPYGMDCRRDKMSGKKDKDLVTRLFEEGQQQMMIKDLPLPMLSALTFGPLVDACRDHVLQFIHLDDDLIGRIGEACWDAVKR